jgi:AraC family transcriptional regulator of adaptative response / DNA-3-methyladenine glycosylase II
MAWPNAFPADVELLRERAAERPPRTMSSAPDDARWAPWRAYAALHVWRLHGDALR